jgi:hypothetical protein
VELTAPADVNQSLRRDLSVGDFASSRKQCRKRTKNGAIGNLGTSDESNSAAAVRKIKFTLLHLPSPLDWRSCIQRKMSELRSPGTGSAGSLLKAHPLITWSAFIASLPEPGT